MKKIRIILTFDKSNAVGVEGEIIAEARAGDKNFGRIYPFGGDYPSFDRMFPKAVKSMRHFLHKHGYPIPSPESLSRQDNSPAIVLGLAAAVERSRR